MATQILNKPSGVILSSSFNDIEISVDGQFVEVSLAAHGSRPLITERYFAYGGSVTLWNLAPLIESELLRNETPYSDFTLSVYDDTAGSVVDSHTFHILYCDRFATTRDVASMLRENFLTSLSRRRVAPDAAFPLFGYADMGESLAYDIAFRASRLDEGDIICDQFQFDANKKADANGVFRVDVSLSELTRQIQSAYPSASAIQSITITCGQRAVTCFVDPELSCFGSFMFRNCFNVLEAGCLPAVTTAKTEVEQSIASIAGKSCFYDRHTTKTHQVETGPLTSDEAEWIDQLFTSFSVFRVESSGHADEFNLRPVLISESSCEVSLNADTPNAVKFSWRYCLDRPMIFFSHSRGIFTNPFDYRFS